MSDIDRTIADPDLAAAIDRTLDRLRALHEYAGRPAWNEILGEELGAAFAGLKTEIATLSHDLAESERLSDGWYEEAHYEVGGAPNLWRVRAEAAERRLLDAGLPHYCGAVSPGSFAAVPTYWQIHERLAEVTLELARLKATSATV